MTQIAHTQFENYTNQLTKTNQKYKKVQNIILVQNKKQKTIKCG